MLVWSFHDRIYTFCKSVLFSNIECLIFEFFRFLNWRKALKSFLYMNITCKAVKIHNFSARDFVTYFLICVEGVNKSLAPSIDSFSFNFRRTCSYFIKKVFKFDSNTSYNLQLYLNVPVSFSWVTIDISGLILSNSVLWPLVNSFFMHYCLTVSSAVLPWDLYHEQRTNATYSAAW